MIGYFAEVTPDGRYAQCHTVELPSEIILEPANAENTLVPVASPPAKWESDSPTKILYLVDGDEQWVETAALEVLRARAIQQIDAAAEALRLAVVNHMTMQSEEYRRVEAQARAWREAGYPEEEGAGAPRGVRGWAMAKWRDGWTNRQAADDILATADGWMHILDEVRDLRLANKEDVRHADDVGEVAAISADMRADMRAMATQLNLTLTE